MRRGGEQEQRLRRAATVEVQEPTTCLDERRELESQVDEGRRPHLTIDGCHRAAQAANQAGIPAPRLACNWQRHVPCPVARALDHQINDLPNPLLRYSEIPKSVQKDIEI